MLRALPDEHRVVSLAQADANLERLQTSSLHGFCPPAAQSKVVEVLAAVRSLVRGQCPVYTSWCGCTNLKKMMDEILPLSLTMFDNDLEMSAAYCRGKIAAEQIFKTCEDHIDEVTLEDLAPLCTYDWLLTREQQQQVQQWNAHNLVKCRDGRSFSSRSCQEITIFEFSSGRERTARLGGFNIGSHRQCCQLVYTMIEPLVNP